MAQSQLQFQFKITTDSGTEEVTTRPGDIVAWEMRHKATFLADQMTLGQMMWIAWRALYREQRTKIAKFDNWFDVVDGFEIVDEQTSDDDQDPTEAATQETESVS